VIIKYIESTVFIQINKAKNSKTVLLPHAGAKGEGRYSSYLFLTWAQIGVSGQRHALAALYPREWIPGTLWNRGLGRPQSWFRYRD
jgi:hypothetical protein